jgi:hypothetical protein
VGKALGHLCEDVAIAVVSISKASSVGPPVLTMRPSDMMHNIRFDMVQKPLIMQNQ